jgi:hypothetical protein
MEKKETSALEFKKLGWFQEDIWGGVWGFRSTVVALPLQNGPLVPIAQGMGWLQSRTQHCEEGKSLLSEPGIESLQSSP